MKTIYHLTHTTVFNQAVPLEYDNLFEFCEKLYKLMDDPYVLNDSINFSTAYIIEPEPVFVSYPASKDELEMEREFQMFKGGRK